MALETALDWLIWGLAGLLILCSLLPLSKLPFGAIRGLAFPREQFLGLALGAGRRVCAGPGGDYDVLARSASH